jgi:two-component system NtrC family sensor kinase
LQHKAILDSVKSIIIISTNLEGDIIVYGQGAQDITGYELEELPKKDYFGKIFFDKNKKPITFNKGINNLFLQPLEWLCRKKDGSYVIILMYIVPQFSLEGKFIGYIFSGVDISNTKKAEVELEHQLLFFQTLIDNIPVAVYYKDGAMNLLGCNKVFEELLEHSKADMIGKNAGDIYYDKQASDTDIKTDAQILKGVSSISYELVLKSKRARQKNIVFYKTSFRTRNDMRGVIGVLIDVTKERKIRSERDKLQISLMQQNKLASLGELTGSIAHELNNPLTIILGYAQVLLKDKTLANETFKGVKNIYDAAVRSQEIIKNMLEFSRTGSLKVQKMNMDPIIEKTLLMVEKDFNKANIEVVKNLTENQDFILINPMQIQQMLLNLMLNAKDAMANGGKLTIKTFVEKNEYVLSISDTGIGIKEENLSKIFDPFFTTKEVGKGTGLGLSICYSIVKNFKGEILVESEIGKGTVFYVKFPVVKRDL